MGGYGREISVDRALCLFVRSHTKRPCFVKTVKGATKELRVCLLASRRHASISGGRPGAWQRDNVRQRLSSQLRGPPPPPPPPPPHPLHDSHALAMALTVCVWVGGCSFCAVGFCADLVGE